MATAVMRERGFAIERYAQRIDSLRRNNRPRGAFRLSEAACRHCSFLGAADWATSRPKGGPYAHTVRPGGDRARVMGLIREAR